MDRNKTLIDLIDEKQMSKRDVLNLGTISAAVAAFAGTTRSASAAGQLDGKSVVFSSWGGAYQDAQKASYCDPFAQKTSATVLQDGPMDEAKFRAMVEAGEPVWDVCDITHEFLFNGIKNNLFEKLDQTKINISRVDERYRNDYAVGCIVWSDNIGYSTAAFKEGEHPKSWADVFDIKKFPGTRILQGGSPSATLEAVTVGDEVSVKWHALHTHAFSERTVD